MIPAPCSLLVHPPPSSPEQRPASTLLHDGTSAGMECAAAPTQLAVPAAGIRQDHRVASRSDMALQPHHKGVRLFADDEDEWGLEEVLQVWGPASGAWGRTGGRMRCCRCGGRPAGAGVGGAWVRGAWGQRGLGQRGLVLDRGGAGGAAGV